jgi:hypothetical protein
VGREGRARGQTLRVLVVTDSSANRLPGSERGDGCIGAEGERHSDGLHRGKRVEGASPLASEPVGVHAVVATPPLVEHGLNAGHDSESSEHLHRGGIDHLDVFQSMMRRRHDVLTDQVSRFDETRDHQIHRSITDDVVAGLNAG